MALPCAVAGFPDLATRADRQVSIPRPPDGLGRRRLVAMDLVNISWHRYDLGWNVLGDYAAGGGSWGVGARVNSYQWHGMTPLAETPGANPGTGATRHHLHDHLGSTRALFDGGKARLARLDYEPHGQPTRALGAAANRSFTGKQYDAAIGMYHFPYRHYSPSHARWMTRDPLGMVDGPNVYAYVRGAAVTAVDPMGTSLLIPAFLGGLIAGGALAWAWHCADKAKKIASNNGGGIGNIVGHCVAGCEFSRCMGPLGGAVPAAALNILYEMQGGLWVDPVDAARDTFGAAQGGGMKHCEDSCYEECRKKHPGQDGPTLAG